MTGAPLPFKHVRNLTNGMRVLGRRGNTLFIRLPTELQTPIDLCRCPYCAAHPNEPPMWDTLAVAQGEVDRDFTWTVHMPDCSDARE